jgi:hypothetical protein
MVRGVKMEKNEEGQNDWVTINTNALNSICGEMDDEFVKNVEK